MNLDYIIYELIDVFIFISLAPYELSHWNLIYNITFVVEREISKEFFSTKDYDKPVEILDFVVVKIVL